MLQKGYINFEQYNHLKPTDNPRPRIFYALPKIHKNPDDWTVPNRLPPGRPIVSDCASESYEVSHFIDHFINPLAQQLPAYLKDSYDLLHKLKSVHVPSDCILFTCDVKSLYTNIDLNRMIAVIRQTFKKFPNPTRPDLELINLLEITLHNNDFLFDNNFYLQTKGISMGKKYAPALANLYLAHFDELARHPQKFTPPLSYFRYIDDIFGIWTDSVENLKLYIGWLSTTTPGVELTLNFSDTHIDFLDLTLFKCTTALNNTTYTYLQTKTYFKPTCTFNWVIPSSSHPPHTSRGILKSQFLRFARQCTSHLDYSLIARRITPILVQAGFKNSLISKTRTGMWDRHLADPTLPTDPQPLPTIPLITTYHPNIAPFLSDLSTLFNNSSLSLKFRILKAYRNNKNLGRHLVRATFTSDAPTDCTVSSNNSLNSTWEFPT